MAGSDATNGTTTQTSSTGADGKGADATAIKPTGQQQDESALGAAPEKKAADGDAKKADASAADKKADEKKPDDKPAPLELKLPEGLDAKAPDVAPLVESLKGLATDAKLSNEQAQKVADAYFKSTEADRKAIAEAIAEKKGHLDAAKADPELGGAKGEKFAASVSYARAAVEKLGGAKLRDTLVKAGLDNHPEVIRAFMRAGRSLAEDNLDGSQANGAAAKAPTSIEAISSLYTHPSSRS